VTESFPDLPLEIDEPLDAPQTPEVFGDAVAVLDAPMPETAGAEVAAAEAPQVARWYAVQVASSCEKKVTATLEQRAVTLGVANRILEIEIPQTPGVKLK
jgi:transcriptional antiterminator NusG